MTRKVEAGWDRKHATAACRYENGIVGFEEHWWNLVTTQGYQ